MFFCGIQRRLEKNKERVHTCSNVLPTDHVILGQTPQQKIRTSKTVQDGRTKHHRWGDTKKIETSEELGDPVKRTQANFGQVEHQLSSSLREASAGPLGLFWNLRVVYSHCDHIRTYRQGLKFQAEKLACKKIGSHRILQVSTSSRKRLRDRQFRPLGRNQAHCM